MVPIGVAASSPLMNQPMDMILKELDVLLVCHACTT
jgi:hypothetical protein